MQTAGPLCSLLFSSSSSIVQRFSWTHIIATVHSALTLCLYPPPPLFPLSVSLWKPIVKTWSFPPQCQCKRAPFAVMARPFGERERWVAPNGKHTVSPESVFEGLPRSSVLTQRLKGAMRALCWMCDKKETKEKNWWAEWVWWRCLYANCFTPNTHQSG